MRVPSRRSSEYSVTSLGFPARRSAKRLAAISRCSGGISSTGVAADQLSGRVAADRFACGIDRREPSLQVDRADEAVGLLEEQPGGIACGGHLIHSRPVIGRIPHFREGVRCESLIRGWQRCQPSPISSRVTGFPAIHPPPLPERKDMNLSTTNRAGMRPRKRLASLALGAVVAGSCVLALFVANARAAGRSRA